ncbi:MAG: bifunctional phosphoribosylaminoimidazolecarboxamide formyltransferase/IMP cyclohydrolase [Chloroflexi bacterium]|nr:bifunctional phosphoribosylaminoimidazolecarboxamide formyltransferase/IMP cyclohydrolase [Chloroflexota bacterium]
MRIIMSVSDKSGLVEFAQGLATLGHTIYSTGGTQAALAAGGVPVHSISEITGFPEILDGRVKTLHPLVHGGLLGLRHNPAHVAQMKEHGIEPIDMVVVNLYPFLAVSGRPDARDEDVIENIDIGGPSMLRSAAKNHESVLVLVDPADYGPVLEQLKAGGVDQTTRRKLAAKAYQHTASYDTHVAAYLRDEPFPADLTVAMKKVEDLRYGENPHQQAAFYVDSPPLRARPNIATAKQLHGKALSYNNYLDLDGALACVLDYKDTAVSIIKHTNPCGLATAGDVRTAYLKAYAGDPVSAFGGIIGSNRVIDEATAREIARHFYEVVVAPGYTDEALDILRTKRDLRIMQVDFPPADSVEHPAAMGDFDFRRVSGGFLVQTLDRVTEGDVSLKVVTEREPTPQELADLMFAWLAVKHVRSNAIVLAKEQALVGVGAGQMSRVDSVEIAVRKAGDRAAGSVLASDAFFPMPDGIQAAAKGGATAIIQPGGSVKDDETIAEANKHGIAMVFTGRRHFKH